KPGGRPGAVHDDIVSAISELARKGRLYAGSLQECELGRMPSGGEHLRAGQGQDPGNKLPQLAVTQDEESVGRPHLNLLENLKGSGRGLGEDGGFVADVVRYTMEVRHGQGQPLGEGAVSPDDSEHRPMRAMIARDVRAGGAFAAGSVDFTDHPPADPAALR